jgi:hypothetical protein
MGERRAYLGCSLQLPLRAQAQSHSNASVARWLELTSRASASWPALCATITPALGPELGTTHVNQVEPGPEVHAHARPAGWARRFFPRRGSYQVLPHKIPQSAHVSLSHKSLRPPHCCPCSALHERRRSRRPHLVAFESRGSEKVSVSSNSQLSYKYIMVRTVYTGIYYIRTQLLRSIRTPWRNRRWCAARRVRTTVPPEGSDVIVAVTGHRAIGEQVA